MNYGEELAYWYLRLNGFFPITNFVLHRGEQLQHNADVDVLAIRAPHVFEPVGGTLDDWDPYLCDQLAFDGFIGVICEVKTGAFEEGRLFRDDYVRYALPRLGLVPSDQSDVVLALLSLAPVAQAADDVQITKLLVTSQASQGGCFLSRTLAQLEDFIVQRVKRYPTEKYGARLFFGSPLLQHLIDRVHREIQER
jgi:hypothetical protein